MNWLMDFWSFDPVIALTIGIVLPALLGVELITKIRRRRREHYRDKLFKMVQRAAELIQNQRGGYFTDGEKLVKSSTIWTNALRGDVLYDVHGWHRRFEDPTSREQVERDKYAEWKRDCMSMDLDQLAEKYYDRENCRLRVPKDPTCKLLRMMDRHERDRIWVYRWDIDHECLVEVNPVECHAPTTALGPYHSHSGNACSVLRLAS